MYILYISRKITKENAFLFQMEDSINTAAPSFTKTLRQNGTGTTSTLACNCLPDCELNEYPGEIATGILNRQFSYNSMSLL